ncbi:hypothetical protein JV173_04360 [Acholeplasma equirhinis]|uniref:pectinesterase family protein n=1 Tax=Acholeplasma equirhinis TaxID=555393 RepID=UPI00197AA5B2|nr:pectinesterase family protein [Acholeplasma equirhinis]MBN3490743.1 hypothetical protein [Acholeplasma equirhinis]
MQIHHINPSMKLQTLLDKLDPNISHTIYLAPGLYHEKIKLSNNNISIIGESKDSTLISFNDYAYKMHDDGLLYNTFRTSTFLITGSNNKLEHLTIMNDAGYGDRIGQAIALSIYGTMNEVIDCNIIANQDTLFLGPLPIDLIHRYPHILDKDQLQSNPTKNFFFQTKITGNVDFIFGSGNALFDSCTLEFNGDGYLAAPSTYKNEIGFVFYRSRITSLSDEFKMILARPWRAFGKTTFIDCTFETKIDPSRYDTWAKPDFYFYEHPHVANPLSQKVSFEFLKQIEDLFDRKF